MQSFACVPSFVLRLLLIGGVSLSIVVDFAVLFHFGVNRETVNWSALDQLHPIYVNNSEQTCTAPILNFPPILSKTFPNYEVPETYSSSSEYFCGLNKISNFADGILTIDCPYW
jgi:hypothetical protein